MLSKIGGVQNFKTGHFLVAQDKTTAWGPHKLGNKGLHVRVLSYVTKKCPILNFLTPLIFDNIRHFRTFSFLLRKITSTQSLDNYKCYTYLKTSESLLFYDKRTFFFGIQKYVKFALITEKGVFLFFCCPVTLFTKLLINPTFPTSTGFMVAHFKANNHEKTIQSLKSKLVKGQMSVML